MQLFLPLVADKQALRPGAHLMNLQLEGTVTVGCGFFRKKDIAVFSCPNPAKGGAREQVTLDEFEVKVSQTLLNNTRFVSPAIDAAARRVRPERIRYLPSVAALAGGAALVFGALSATCQIGDTADCKARWSKTVHDITSIPARLDAMARGTIPHP